MACYHGDCKRGGGKGVRRLVKRLVRAGPCTWSFSALPRRPLAPSTHSSLWPTLCVQDCSPSPTPFFPIAFSSTPSPPPLQYPPLSSMPSNLRATSTPWASTSQRAARAFWSHIFLSCLSIRILTHFIPQILANFSLLLSLMCGRLVQQLFFGSLRAVEVEVGLQVFFDAESDPLAETLRPHVVLCHRVTSSIHHFQRRD